jgi:hypothetical protein
MNVFYDHCLESLYPPGSCGTYCNDVSVQRGLQRVSSPF